MSMVSVFIYIICLCSIQLHVLLVTTCTLQVSPVEAILTVYRRYQMTSRAGVSNYAPAERVIRLQGA
jgi:hypothetical protein